MNPKSNRIMKEFIYGLILLALIVSITNFYGNRIAFGLWARTWHLTNPSKVYLNEKVVIDVPKRWWVIKKKDEGVVFAMVPKEEKDRNFFLGVYLNPNAKGLTLEEAKKYSECDCGVVEVQAVNVVQLAGAEAFQTRYINNRDNTISEVWVIPSVGCVIKIRDVAQHLYPDVARFLSNFKIN